MKIFKLFPIGLLLIPLTLSSCINNSSTNKITFGISPYQDTYLPKLAEEKGWFKEADVNVETVTLAWGDVMYSIASSQGANIAITNFNSFLAAYEQLSLQGAKPIFLYPLFVFKGPAILVRSDSKLQSVEEIIQAQSVNREEAIRLAASQLKGSTIITTKDTEMEQIVVAAAQKAQLEVGKDFKILYANPEDGLAAFLGGEGTAYSGGLTERFRAKDTGAKVLLEAADVTPPVINGIVTTEEFARNNPEQLKAIIKVWFRTISYMEQDLDTNSEEFLQYLNSVSSVQYTKEQYKFAWKNMEVFFDNSEAVEKKVLTKTSPYYWKQSWDSINKFLIEQGEIKKAVPDTAFWGVNIQESLTNSQNNQTDETNLQILVEVKKF